jgi:hypothetical protein
MCLRECYENKGSTGDYYNSGTSGGSYSTNEMIGKINGLVESLILDRIGGLFQQEISNKIETIKRNYDTELQKIRHDYQLLFDEMLDSYSSIALVSENPKVRARAEQLNQQKKEKK